MDLINPENLAKAIQPLVDKMVTEAMQDLSTQVIPALGLTISGVLDSYTIKISFEKKDASGK